MARDGKEEDGMGEWSSPAFVVAKEGSSKWRGVVDFAALNEATIPDSHALPRIEDLLVLLVTLLVIFLVTLDNGPCSPSWT